MNLVVDTPVCDVYYSLHNLVITSSDSRPWSVDCLNGGVMTWKFYPVGRSKIKKKIMLTVIFLSTEFFFSPPVLISGASSSRDRVGGPK